MIRSKINVSARKEKNNQKKVSEQFDAIQKQLYQNLKCAQCKQKNRIKASTTSELNDENDEGKKTHAAHKNNNNKNV